MTLFPKVGWLGDDIRSALLPTICREISTASDHFQSIELAYHSITCLA